MKYLSVILSLVLVICCLAACGDKDSGHSDTAAEKSSVKSAAQEQEESVDPTSAIEDPATSNGYVIKRKAYPYQPENLFNYMLADSNDYIWVYDQNGNVDGCYTFANGTLNNTTRFFYDEDGVLIRSTSGIGAAAGQKKSWSYEYTYNDDGTVDVMKRVYDGPDIGETKTGEYTDFAYEYENGALSSVTETTVSPNGRERACQYDVTCNGNGDITQIQWYYEDSSEYNYYITAEYENDTLSKAYYHTVHGDDADLSEAKASNIILFDERNNPIKVTIGNLEYTYEYDDNDSITSFNGYTSGLSRYSVSEDGTLQINN